MKASDIPAQEEKIIPVKLTENSIPVNLTENAKLDLEVLNAPMDAPISLAEQMQSKITDTPLDITDEIIPESTVSKTERVVTSTVRSPIRKKKYAKVNFKSIKSNPRKFY